MTFLAVVPELTAMSVVAAVTTDACARQRYPRFCNWRAMTRMAVEARVRAVEREIRLRVVIEPP